MECYTGFDMVPRLSKGAADRQKWQSFIENVKEQYGNDNQVQVKANYIEFNSDLRLPFEGHKFLRFSSRSLDSNAEGAGDYVKAVIDIAKEYFDSRIRTWNDTVKEGFYNCKEVDASFQSYEQVSYCDSILSIEYSQCNSQAI